jgi:hypothetical protein
MWAGAGTALHAFFFCRCFTYGMQVGQSYLRRLWQQRREGVQMGQFDFFLAWGHFGIAAANWRHVFKWLSGHQNASLSQAR